MGAFIGLGAASIAVEGALSTGPALIAGASGSIAVLMGACVVLQPQAKVYVRMRFAVPIWLYGLLELLYQAAMAALGGAGVAWIAHLAGLVLGAGFGLAWRRAQ